MIKPGANASDFTKGAALVLGASGALGAACAEKIGADGNNLALTYRSNQLAITELKRRIEEKVFKGFISSHKLDVSSTIECLDLVRDVVSAHGRINTLIYAIGTNIAQPLVAEITPQQWSEVVNQDLQGFMNIVQPVIQHMRDNGGGSLIHISSAGLRKTPSRDALSVAPKAAIDALMRTIAVEEGANKIRANSVGVGVIEAGIFKRLEAKGVFDENWKAAVKAILPLSTFGSAEDIAEAVNFLASERAKYITGQCLFVDGGYSA